MPCDGDTGYAKGSSPGDAALDWSGRTRSARPARMDKPLRCRPLEGQRDHRSPLRRCFKPRPPWRTGCAGFASGCRSSSEEETFLRRLAGLLSRYLPTDTWPQARANLGKRGHKVVRCHTQAFSRLPTRICKEICKMNYAVTSLKG